MDEEPASELFIVVAMGILPSYRCTEKPASSLSDQRNRLMDEPVPKLFPRFKTAPFFNKTQKYGFSCPE
jgi:hypothetical protein